MTLILASSSPRRHVLLKAANIEHRIELSRVMERSRHETESPEEYACSLSAEKAREVSFLHPDDVVLGADTVVVCDDTVLGKPQGEEEAREMLRLLRGRSHRVVTGVTVQSPAMRRSGTVCTIVTMNRYTDEDIDSYVRTGVPLDKAGGYAIQESNIRLVASVEGCYTNVVGLPMCLVADFLVEANLMSPGDSKFICEHVSPPATFSH